MPSRLARLAWLGIIHIAALIREWLPIHAIAEGINVLEIEHQHPRSMVHNLFLELVEQILAAGILQAHQADFPRPDIPVIWTFGVYGAATPPRLFDEPEVVHIVGQIAAITKAHQ